MPALWSGKDRPPRAPGHKTFLQLWQSRQLEPFVSHHDLAEVINGTVTSRIDYCNALCVRLVRRLQLAQNAAAWVLTGTPRREHVQPMLCQLHRLQVESQAKDLQGPKQPRASRSPAVPPQGFALWREEPPGDPWPHRGPRESPAAEGGGGNGGLGRIPSPPQAKAPCSRLLPPSPSSGCSLP